MTVRMLTVLLVVGVSLTGCGTADDTIEEGGEATTTSSPESTTTPEQTTSTSETAPSTDSTSTTGAARPGGYGYEQPADETTSTTGPDTTTTTDGETTSSTGQTTTTTSTTTADDETDDDVTIEIENFSFTSPGEVEAGTAVTVFNRDSAPHTWTANDGTFDSGRIAPGESVTITLTEPGQFGFFCEIHPSMTGSITVTG